MKRPVISSVILGLVILLLLATPVFAYLYRSHFTILESGGVDYTMLALTVDANNEWMAANGFMEPDALDTRVETLGEIAKPHMVADDRTLTAIVVPANSQTNLYYSTGNSDLTSTYVITGLGGYIMVEDHADLELSDTYDIEIVAYVDTGAGADKNLIFKDAAFRLYVSAAGSITAAVTGGNSVTATTIAPGEHTIHVYADAVTLAIQIDSGVPVTNAVGFAAVPDNGNDWYYFQTDVAPYVESIEVVIG